MKNIIFLITIFMCGFGFSQTGTTVAGQFKMNTPVIGANNDSVVVWNGVDKKLKFVKKSTYLNTLVFNPSSYDLSQFNNASINPFIRKNELNLQKVLENGNQVNFTNGNGSYSYNESNYPNMPYKSERIITQNDVSKQSTTTSIHDFAGVVIIAEAVSSTKSAKMAVGTITDFLLEPNGENYFLTYDSVPTTPPFNSSSLKFFVTTPIDGVQANISMPNKTLSGNYEIATKDEIPIVQAGTGVTVTGTFPNVVINSTATGGVTSVNAQTGVVNLNVDNIPETANRKYQTANQSTFNDATSSIQTQINSKQPAGNYALGTGIANGTNTGDNATNSQYSGLTSSKEDTANKQNSLVASSTKFPTVDAVNSGLSISKDRTNHTGTQLASTISDFTAQSRSSNSFVSGIGGYNSTTGVISIPTTTNQLTNNSGFLTAFSETDPIVKAVNGIVKSNGTTISNAVAGTDYALPNAINSNYENDYRLSNFVSGTNYLAPNGSAISLTNFPTLNQNTTGTASNIIATSNNTLTSLPNLNITQSQVANLVTDLSNKQNNLVSGSNIKTVFGNSLLGSSNLTFTQNDILDGTTNRTFTDVEKTKLANITPIVATTTADYFRGDKTFQPSTSLPISMATQTALDLKDNDYTVTKKVTWDVNATTGGLWIGNSGNGQGVFQALWSTVFNKYTLWNRSRYSNVVTTLNQQLGQICTNNSFSLQTGYKFFATAGFDTWTNGGRIFIGTTQSINSIASEPSSFNNTIGFQSNTTDNGLIYFGTRDGATINRVSTGFTVSNNSGYIFQYNVLPNATSVSYKITDINTGLTNSGVLTTNLPSLTTIVTAKVLASNGNLTAVNSIQIGVNSIVLEHNY